MAGRPPGRRATRELAVVLHDVAWLLPRTVGRAAAEQEPLPTSELEVMRLLARRPGLRVNDVAAELGLRANNVSAAVRALEDRGLVRRVADDTDGRVVRLEPTSAAVAARERRETSWAQELTAALARLDPADRAALVTAAGSLRRLANTLAGTE